MYDYEQEHLELLRGITPGCTVLLRRNGAFPLEKAGELALYGSGARYTVKGGTGSGDVNSRSFLTIEEALEQEGFTITTKYWLDDYDLFRSAAKDTFIQEIRRRAKEKHTMAVLEGMGAVMPEPEYRIPLYGEGDTAVYVLSRISGEGNDRQAVGGDLLLTETEKRDILALNRKYPRFLLVLNVGGPVDLSPLEEVGNILILSQLGVVTGPVLADLLLGRSYPSGKLTTTWSAWGEGCNLGDFAQQDNTEYREGIYVGYRWFDSVGKEPMFPFGFGLGYTDFAIKAGEAKAEGEWITLTAAVTNTGKRPGREVVQLYASQPAGVLDKPYQVLAAFAKTGELQPGETETVSLRFSVRDLASFDDFRGAWVLEKGDYTLRLGNSSRSTDAVVILRLDKDAVLKHTVRCLGKPEFTDWAPEKLPKGKKHRFLKVLKISAASLPEQPLFEAETRVEPEAAQLSPEELAYMSVGAFSEKGGALSVIGNAAISVAGAAGETYGGLKDRGIPSLVMADGPAGLRLNKDFTVDEKGVHPIGETMPAGISDFLPGPAKWVMSKMNQKPIQGEVKHQYCTAIPIGTAIAQSWDLSLAEACGDLVGDEMRRFGIHLWLAPALNIHRDVRCGRNFEYFSEDPLISGKFAAAITRGVQKHPGRAVTIKHYAANNQETNRYFNNSRVSERALREIYLKGFEICVRESQPKTLMTSYNLLNGIHTSERQGLIERILRQEFGFTGVVMTDWIIGMLKPPKGSLYKAPRADRIAAAGNDLTMPGGTDDVKAILSGLENGTVTEERLRINVSRVIRLAKELNG